MACINPKCYSCQDVRMTILCSPCIDSISRSVCDRTTTVYYHGTCNVCDYVGGIVATTMCDKCISLYRELHDVSMSMCSTCLDLGTVRTGSVRNLCLKCAREISPNKWVSMFDLKDIVTTTDCISCKERNTTIVMIPVCDEHIVEPNYSV